MVALDHPKDFSDIFWAGILPLLSDPLQRLHPQVRVLDQVSTDF
jgi:hypothetical protein